MKITGGVADQRVFGKVGPGAPAEILAGLLDGTGSNMLLRENAAHTPVELVLTPRGGGATPPGPFASGADDDAPAIDESPAHPAAPPSQQSQGPPQPSAPQTSGFGGGPVAVPAAGTGRRSQQRSALHGHTKPAVAQRRADPAADIPTVAAVATTTAAKVKISGLPSSLAQNAGFFGAPGMATSLGCALSGNPIPSTSIGKMP